MLLLIFLFYNCFSSGVGRTGMFIALLTQLKRAEKEKSIDIYRYVQYMRQQRPSMVLNEVTSNYH